MSQLLDRARTRGVLNALLLASLALVGCGGSSQNSNHTSSGGSAGNRAAASSDAGLPPAPAGLHGPEKAWAQMTHDERADYMSQTIIPAMRPLFAAYDDTRFGRIGCGTCHGSDARAVNFRMPSPQLYRLPAFGSEAGNADYAAKHRGYEFMSEIVKTSMASMLGKTPFDPRTNTGEFGCYACHTHD